MKKQLLIGIAILIIILVIIIYGVIQNIQKNKNIVEFNKQYTKYMDMPEIYGTDVTSIINKTINYNEKNKIEKDEKGCYINNNENSVRIFIKLVQDGGYYPMERILEVGITEFVKNFNIENFKCTDIKYHDETKRVSEVYFEVIE